MKTYTLGISVLVVALASGNASAQIFGFPSSAVGTPNAEVLAKVRSALGLQGIQNAPSWTTASEKAAAMRRAGRNVEAAAIYKPALDEMRVQESSTDESQKRGLVIFGLARISLLRDYGDVLNKLNRPEEALPLFQQLAAIEQSAIDASDEKQRAQGWLATKSTSASPPTSPTVFDVSAAMQSGMSNALNLVRYLNRKTVVYESANGTSFEESLEEQLPETKVTALSIADSYSRMGDRQSTLAAFDGPFQVYIRRQGVNINANTRLNLDMAVETACLRFALILARVGPSLQQDQAFKCALDLNLQNLRLRGASTTVEALQEGDASQRRLFVGAFAEQSLKNAPSDLSVQRKLVELIADSKGLGTRYSQWIRQTLYHSDSSQLKRLRPQLAELEKSRMNLPISGSEALKAMVDWENAHAVLMRDALPQLNAEGLAGVFIDGVSVVKQAQQKLGEDALIGFSIYRPVDLKTMRLIPGRVLRYCITGSTVEVKDIGTVKEMEAQVFRWRSAVAAGEDASASLISASLIGDLPDKVVKAKTWVIDPDGIISLVPFEALRVVGGDTVLSRHTVRYVTSIAQFAKGSAEITNPSKSALVIANPTFESENRISDSGNVTRSVPTASGVLIENLTFAQLPHTAAEATRVKGALERLGLATDVRLGRDATIDALKFSSAPRYLHIATHGIYMAPGTDPNSNAFIRVATVIPGMQSALVFSPTRKGTIFTGADFARLSLSGTELVVLSACDTGNGSVNVGEGVESLRMAVEAAGAKSSITSLWPVPSEATAELMGTFYDQLGQGVSKGDALRFAKLQLMRTRPKPINWAGFLLSGQP